MTDLTPREQDFLKATVSNEINGSNVVPNDKVADNRRKIEHCVSLLKLPPCDTNDPAAVLVRSEEYLNMCASDGVKPTVSGFATAIKLTRTTVLNYLKGVRKCNPDTLEVIKMMYSTIQTYTESGTLDGSINAVAGIFVMRNNFGYSNDDNRNALTVAEEEEQKPTAEELAAKYADAPD